MVLIKEKEDIKIEIKRERENAIRQDSKISLSIFNYCFLVYFYLLKEIKKNAHFAKGVLLDVGCGASPFKDYFIKYVDKYLKHEHPEAAKENIKYDYLSELPKINAPDNSIDTIISWSVLEHVSEPFETIKEFNRILKANGIFIISVPQYWHLHEEPHDYLRFTKHILNEKITRLGFEIVYMKEEGRSFAVVGQAFCNAMILLFDLNHVKNIFNFLGGKKSENITKSILYTIYKSPLILLSIILIPVINIVFLILDKLLGSPRDTIGYFVIAKKR
ncbi:MAG: methyltransferase domain-containing protein [Candidatus Melainabacteria bacterium]|nr:methyltransferase domain-containing protein [Candidatus Melainabacteria bacterium]